MKSAFDGIVKVDQARIDAIGDQECIAHTIIELAIPPHFIVQAICRGSFQECRDAIDKSEGPTCFGPMALIAHAYGGVMTVREWTEFVEDKKDHADNTKVGFMVPTDPSIIN